MKRKEDLQTLLQMVNVQNVKEHFDKIANILFKDFHIEKGGVRYDFLEVEFYSSLIDSSAKETYPRICEAGDFFPHYSGVDIAFKSDEHLYGGVLIRSLLKDKNEVIAGPLRCFCELCKGMNISGRPISLQLVENEKRKEDIKIEWTIRQGIAIDKENVNNKYCAYTRERDNCDKEWKNGTQYYNAKPWEREKSLGNNR